MRPFVRSSGFNQNMQTNTRGPFESQFDIQASLQTTKSQREQQPQINGGVHSPTRSPTQDTSFKSLSPMIPTTSSFHSGPASTSFGVNVFKQMATEQSGNLAASPFSITILLAMLQQGAAGNTLDEITRALQMTPEKSAEIFKKVNEEIQKRNSRNILKTANNVFLSENFNLNPQFKRIAVNNFDSDLTPTYFGKPALAAQNINSWIASKTNDKIDKLVSPDDLSGNTQMVMVNAVYFKGLWEIPFREQATQKRNFTLNGGEKKVASFMQTRRYFKAGTHKPAMAKVVVLPFEYNEYSLIVVLPLKSSNVDALLSSLSMEDVASFLDLPPKDVALELPKFSIKADINLEPVLNKMGVSSIFTQQAELYNLGSHGSLSPQVSSALHSAVLTIDERGGSAAAATSFAAVALSYDEPSLYFRANKPFLAILWDNRSSIPLFMARIMDPTV